MYLGLDFGTSSVKALLVDGAQRVLASASSPLAVSRPAPGHSEQDPWDWWQAMLDAVGALRAREPAAFAALRGIGLSGQMHGAVLLDAAGEVLRPCILWNDTRSTAECRELEEAFPALHEVAGNLAMPGFTAPKLLWVRKHEPGVFARTAKVLLPKAWVRYRLTGEFIEDMSDASGTLWLDVGQRDWSDAALAATGLSRDHMPRLVEGSAPGGMLRPELLREWGLSGPVVVAGSAGDNAAGAVGLGAIHPGEAFVSLGTSGVLWATTDRYAPYPKAAVHAFCHALPGLWHQMGVTLSAASCLGWWAQVAGQGEAALLAELPAIRKPSEAVFLPYLSGERTPHNDGAVRGAFAGLSMDTERAALTQAVLEGVAFSFRDCLDALAASGTVIREADVIGGGSRSRAWIGIIAAVLGIPLHVLAEGEYGGAFGGARLARLAVTGEDPAAVCTPPRRLETVMPDAELTGAYAAPLRRYRALYPAIAGSFS
ncbi:Xylulose kinase [Roseomonas mucosa]|uniref:Xylulose kinase n=1 Tax=Roseomonas mucosa TaxID=207340 RepID=A0A1S8DB50_9PROT|nr:MULTISPECIES: xylulokinase [Roseomonas]MDT8262054.1 xylulokinase [Roseomonas sp. DSM 102946]ATR21007.1 xylulokinase [Roseomonas sp. FDAARGOS_362]ONH85149.1 xylulokinase [Roseomonas mucosa]QDJ09363.1 Xylulose kinase [Roseomonas mucosa]USQ70931.1 xylulokinase [Roseomonas mucosa]